MQGHLLVFGTDSAASEDWPWWYQVHSHLWFYVGRYLSIYQFFAVDFLSFLITKNTLINFKYFTSSGVAIYNYCIWSRESTTFMSVVDNLWFLDPESPVVRETCQVAPTLKFPGLDRKLIKMKI